MRVKKIALPLLSMLALAVLASLCPKPARADDPLSLPLGPLTLTVPLKSVRVTYLYDFHASQNLVGGETPFITAWNRVEGTLGAVTSLQGQGTPFLGGNILVGNLLDRYVTLPADLAIGGFGGYNVNASAPIYGIKASVKLW